MEGAELIDEPYLFSFVSICISDLMIGLDFVLGVNKTLK